MTPKSLQKQREYRKRTNNVVTKRYEKTIKGLLVRTYQNMKSRVNGTLKKKAHLYKGLPILTKEAFKEWALNDPTFNKLYNDWVISNYDRKLSPSINRIDSSKGYLLDNIEWITHSENSRLGSISRNKKDSNG